MNILHPTTYPNARIGRLCDQQAEIRRLAYALKDTACRCADIEKAALAMAPLIQGPCWLVPIPNSHCSLIPNARLCAAIASHVAGAQMVPAITRTAPIPSQCLLHKASLPPIRAEEHHIRATGRSLGLRQVYFVDNVATSGNTMAAAYAALGRGAGLVFAATTNHPTAHAEPSLFTFNR